MSDTYTQIVNAPVVSSLASSLGLPRPVELDRFQTGQPVIKGPVLTGAAPDGRMRLAISAVLDSIVAERAGAEGKAKALIFDATGISDSAQLVELQRFFYPGVSRLMRSGRVIVMGTPPEATGTVRAHIAQRALEGFVRSLAKEVGGRGATAELVYVDPGAEADIDSTLRFLLSPRSAYVSGQVIRISKPAADTPDLDWNQPLEGLTALVTGASRGIGESIASTLARDGATVVGLDIPPAAEDLEAVTSRLGGRSISLDITADDAPEAIASELADGVDVIVHNAGVTLDRTIAKMPEERWTRLMEINLSSEERINDEILARGLLRPNGRIVCVSSMSGIAGNSGQTNYAASKAGVIGMVEAMAPELAKRKATINAVAPGFIETQMTAAMPFGPREVGRRLCSLSQGGKPVDVAETIAYFASPASGGVNGNTVRVCGQNLLGA
ncbi:MAG TPA: 3-oxoacyl-ACP reductase [Solirubrobacterales bacterium]|nr:3-oxoacyl-ACP reductase [Solirubrobacterales bacterium]